MRHFPTLSPFLYVCTIRNHLITEWHPTKNKELSSKDFTHGSKKKVWWLCPKGHSYESTPNHRTAMKSGCPYCAEQKTLNYDLWK